MEVSVEASGVVNTPKLQEWFSKHFTVPASSSTSSGSPEGSAPPQCHTGSVVLDGPDTHLTRRSLPAPQKQPLQTPKATRTTRHSCSVLKLFLVVAALATPILVLQCLLTQHGYLCVQAKPEDIPTTSEFMPVGSDMPVVGNLPEGSERWEKCKKLDRKGHLSEDLLMNKLTYSVRDDRYCAPSDMHHLNLAKELAEHSQWRNVANRVGVNPEVIVDHYKQTAEEERESSRKLLNEIYRRGYKGKYDWNMYVKGLKRAELYGIAEELVSILKCSSIPLDRKEKVEPAMFHSITCKETRFRLEEQVSEHWRDLAKAFNIRERFISPKVSVPESGASEVLSKLYARGYKKQYGWQGVLDVLWDSQAHKLWETLNEALDCVCLVS